MNKDKIPKIKPELGGGLRDYLPKDMIPRQKILDTIRGVFESFGFLPIDTPAIEKKVILTGGDPEFKKQLFEIKSPDGEGDLALRFDLTVPLARVVSAYPNEIKKPFKRYQVGKVFRGERSQAGRFKEFLQFDADIVGAPSVLADAEIVVLMNETLTRLGVKNFLIRINNRKILNGLAEFAGFKEEKTGEVLRAIDKLDRDGWSSVEKDLSIKLKSKDSIKAIKEFINLSISGEPLVRAGKIMKKSPTASMGVEELERISGYLKAYGIPEKNWKIDFSVARGLGYYTGPVFEAVLKDLPQIGSIFSGGRYDDLVARFGGQTIPATGASVGVDRLFAAIEKLGLVDSQTSIAKVIVLNFDENCVEYVAEITAKLRRAGIATNLYLGQEKSLKGQLAYAISEGYEYVVLAGSEEKSSAKVQVKNIKLRTQTTVSLKDIEKGIVINTKINLS
ncbi:MAG: histidyl-tRNA synthetase [Parcubacteria group bacterium Gr01-1014_20]|nr:MAG: histidyl-tRNA synthetase [Parcubacteria group bacterium Gr01-1014_20]